jgi:hypothetical protein
LIIARKEWARPGSAAPSRSGSGFTGPAPRSEQLVDKLGDPDSIFEKMRIIIRNLPGFMLPADFDADFDGAGDMPYMKIVNRQTGVTITGESGDNIGRGGHKLIYFKDD